MALRTDKIERLHNPDGYGKRIGNCEDSVEFFLTCHKNTLASVSFCIRSCMNTNACCNTAAMPAQGETIEKALEISPEQVIEYLETLPQDHLHCAELVTGAITRQILNLYKKCIKMAGEWQILQPVMEAIGLFPGETR